jgi:mannose-6-phosphate isomerase-like protein (cupin superfamily)
MRERREMPKNRTKASEAVELSKHGIDLRIYDHDAGDLTVAHVDVQVGHFQEFYNSESSYLYYIIAGEGVFYLDGEPLSVGPGDLLAVPPNTRIYYVGAMQMLLMVTPTFDPESEQEVRRIAKSELVPD